MEDIGWSRLQLSGGADALEMAAALLLEAGAGGIEEGAGWIAAYFDPADRARIDDVLSTAPVAAGLERSWTEICDEDWWEAWKEHFKPVQVSKRLAICPSWEEWEPADPATLVLKVDPGRAFGTGAHETTRMCLVMLDDHLEGVADPSALEVLDVGTGSGILSVAALKLGVGGALGFDLDPLAVECSRENAALNSVGEKFSAFCGDVRSVEDQYPLVFMNILYQIVLGISGQVASRVQNGGFLILAGMLREETDAAAALFENLGFAEVRRLAEGEWGGLLLKKIR